MSSISTARTRRPLQRMLRRARARQPDSAPIQEPLFDEFNCAADCPRWEEYFDCPDQVRLRVGLWTRSGSAPYLYGGLVDGVCETILRRLLRDLADPVEVRHNEAGRVAVVLLECLAWLFEPDGSAGPLRRRDSGELWSDARRSHDLGHPSHRKLWLSAYVDLVIDGLKPPDRQASARANRREIAWKVSRLLEGNLRDWKIRDLVRAQLPLDPAIVELTLRCRTLPRRRRFMNTLYNCVRNHRRVMERVRQQTPNLLPWIASALVEREIRLERGDLALQLKDALLQLGVTKSGWRLLSQTPPRKLREAIWLDRRVPVLCALASMLVRSQSLNPPRLMRPVLYRWTMGSRKGDRTGTTARTLQLSPRFFEQADRRIREAMAEPNFNQFLWNEFAPVMVCAGILEEEVGTEMPRGGWLAWRRFAREFPIAAHLQPPPGTAWPAARASPARVDWKVAFRWLPPAPGERYGALVLSSFVQLAMEGRLMTNCVAQYGMDCLRGRVRLLSIRESENSAPAADAMIILTDGCWKPMEVHGVGNRPADDEMIYAATRAAAEYSRCSAQALPDFAPQHD